MVGVVVAVVGFTPLAFAQLDPLTRAVFACGAWCEAAKSAANQNVGLGVEVNSSGENRCQALDDLLAAEAESVLRRFGFVVRPNSGSINGGSIDISVAALEDDASGRCVTSLQMTFSITRWLPGTDEREPYFAKILVDNAPLWAMVHPPSSHSQVLRTQVNEQVTLWANELARRSAR